MLAVKAGGKRLDGSEINQWVRNSIEILECKVKGTKKSKEKVKRRSEEDKGLLKNIPGTLVAPHIHFLASVYLHESVAEANLVYPEKDKENCDHDAKLIAASMMLASETG